MASTRSSFVKWRMGKDAFSRLAMPFAFSLSRLLVKRRTSGAKNICFITSVNFVARTQHACRNTHAHPSAHLEISNTISFGQRAATPRSLAHYQASGRIRIQFRSEEHRV